MKLQYPFVLIMILSMVLCACQPAATLAPTQAAQPTVEAIAPTAIVAETVPTLQPQEMAPLLAELTASLDAQEGYATLTLETLSATLADNPPFLVDVREVSEVETNGFIEGAINIPIRTLLDHLDKLPGLDRPIVIYCGSGHRSAFALAALSLLGYTDVKNLAGGLGAWSEAGLSIAGGKPAEAPSISTPIIANERLYATLRSFLASLPDNFSATNAIKLSEALQTTSFYLYDVRAQGEKESQGTIQGSISLPFEEFVNSQAQWPVDRNAAVVIYCGTGHRSAVLTMVMYLMGYTNVMSLGGGMRAWLAAELPVE